MTMPSTAADEFRLSLASTLADVDEACLRAQAFLLTKPWVQDQHLILLALREALTNAVLHGNQKNPGLRVECLISVCENELAMTISDQGQGFAWREHKRDMPQPDSESGRGLAIIETCFDRIEFNDSGNEITFRKKLDPRGGTGMIDIVQDGSEATVKFTEDLLVGSKIEEVRVKLSALVEQGVTSLAIDLEEVQTVDSLGMGMLVATHNTLKSKNGSLSLFNVQPKIYTVLTIMRLDKHFSISKAE